MNQTFIDPSILRQVAEHYAKVNLRHLQTDFIDAVNTLNQKNETHIRQLHQQIDSLKEELTHQQKQTELLQSHLLQATNRTEELETIICEHQHTQQNLHKVIEELEQKANLPFVRLGEAQQKHGLTWTFCYCPQEFELGKSINKQINLHQLTYGFWISAVSNKRMDWYSVNKVCHQYNQLFGFKEVTRSKLTPTTRCVRLASESEFEVALQQNLVTVDKQTILLLDTYCKIGQLRKKKTAVDLIHTTSFKQDNGPLGRTKLSRVKLTKKSKCLYHLVIPVRTTLEIDPVFNVRYSS